MNRNKKTYPFLRHANHKLEIHLYDDPAKRYLALLEIIRSRLPDAVIRSTFMLGFPGETEEDFAELLDFQKKANIDWLGCFTYSREEGTASYSMKGRVPEKIAVMRKSLIEEKQLTITEKNMERFVDQVFDVLIEEEFAAEGTDSNEENIWLGRLFCQAPEIDGTAVIISPPEDPLFQQQPRSKQPEQENLANEQKLQAGVFVRCKVTSRMGFDLEVRPINIIK